MELKYQFASNPGTEMFTIEIINNGTKAIDLSTVTVRYYFAGGSTSGWIYACDSAQIQSPYTNINADVQGTFKASGATAASASEYLQIAFAAGSPVLPAGATAAVQSRFSDSKYALTQTADYSYAATGSAAFVDNKKITVYIGTKLVWGTEPM